MTTDVNTEAEQLTARCTDGVVWSINNWMIFRAPVLDSGLRIYNIHNGLLPQHRGLPSAAIAYALLQGHAEYGATLHQVDAGIDTGQVLAEQPFPIAPDARYHQVLLRGIQACHQLFQRTLPAIAAGHPPEPPLPRTPSPAPTTAAGPCANSPPTPPIPPTPVPPTSASPPPSSPNSSRP